MVGVAQIHFEKAWEVVVEEVLERAQRCQAAGVVSLEMRAVRVPLLTVAEEVVWLVMTARTHCLPPAARVSLH